LDNSSLENDSKDNQKNLNLTDCIISPSKKNSLFNGKYISTNYEYEIEKLEFFDNFNFENLYNFHKYFSRLITNFEINKDFFQREKFLNKIFEILNSNNNNEFNSPQRSIKFFEDKAISKNLKIYFFLEMTILALLFHPDIFQNNDLYCAFKYCLFYLNQNLLIITHFLIDKIENIEKFLKKDTNFEAFYKNYISLNKNKNNFFNKNNFNNSNNNYFNEENKPEDIFSRNLMDKKYLKLCIDKLNENKTWLDKHFIFKNFNSNNKNLVNVCKNICDIFIKSTDNNPGFLVVYYEIKDILNDIGKIKLEKNLDNLNEKVKFLIIFLFSFIFYFL